MWKLMFPQRRHIVLLLVGSVLVFALAYLRAVKGEPYEYALEWVKSDLRVIKVIGSQYGQGFNFWQGYEYSYGTSDGSASLELSVDGDNGKFRVPLVLRKRQGRWFVVSAKVVNAKGDMIVIVD